ncbi:MAG: hypothetical protein ABJL99_15055 [Aliishimia sp.]
MCVSTLGPAPKVLQRCISSSWHRAEWLKAKNSLAIFRYADFVKSKIKLAGGEYSSRRYFRSFVAVLGGFALEFDSLGFQLDCSLRHVKTYIEEFMPRIATPKAFLPFPVVRIDNVEGNPSNLMDPQGDWPPLTNSA